MANSSEAISKLCSTLHKYIDKKNSDKILPILKKLDVQKPKDLNEKDRKNIYEVGSRVKRKFEEDEFRQIAGRLKEKFASAKSSKSDEKDKKKKEDSKSDKKTDAKEASKSNGTKKSERPAATTKQLADVSTSEFVEPKRHKTGVLVFTDFPDFQPNRTPKEVLQAGSFGGTYFRPIYSSVTKQKYGPEVWKELPQDWIEGLNIKTQVASAIYDEKLNKYKAKCGGSLQMWEESGWINEQDPYGWFQWYCRFYQGRRTEDDARQVSRWWNCASVNGRWRNNLISKIFKSGGSKFDNAKISPVVRQTLLHWAYELTEDDYLKRAKKLSK